MRLHLVVDSMPGYCQLGCWPRSGLDARGTGAFAAWPWRATLGRAVGRDPGFASPCRPLVSSYASPGRLPGVVPP